MGRRPTLRPLHQLPWHSMGDNCPRCTLNNDSLPTHCVVGTEGHDMGYSDENKTDPKDQPKLPVGCIFDGAMGWHNTYRIVDLALSYGMDKDESLGWDENDAKIMAAYENSDTEVVLDNATALGQQEIGDTAQHWCEKAEEYLQQFLPPLSYLEWDDGLYVRAMNAEEVRDTQAWNDGTVLVLAMQFIENLPIEQQEKWDEFCRAAAMAENEGADLEEGL